MSLINIGNSLYLAGKSLKSTGYVAEGFSNKSGLIRLELNIGAAYMRTMKPLREPTLGLVHVVACKRRLVDNSVEFHEGIRYSSVSV